jgi:CRP/FNR family transcriptional regulator
MPRIPPPGLPTALDAFRSRYPESLLVLAHARGTPRELAPGAVLFTAGDRVTGLHLVLDGALRIVRESAGRATVVHEERAGGMLGEVAYFTDGIYPGTAEALEPSRLLLLHSDDVERALASDHALARWMLGRLAARTREVIGRLDRVAHLTVLQRLASHLLARHRAVARGGVRSVAFSLGMTQARLAEELGTVKPLVVRELGTLTRLGVVERAGDGRYRVRDAGALERLASARR